MSVHPKGNVPDYLEKSRRRRRRELSEEQKQEITEAFNLFDSDKDQALDYYELKVTIAHYLVGLRQTNHSLLLAYFLVRLENQFKRVNGVLGDSNMSMNRWPFELWGLK